MFGLQIWPTARNDRWFLFTGFEQLFVKTANRRQRAPNFHLIGNRHWMTRMIDWPRVYCLRLFDRHLIGHRILTTIPHVRRRRL